VLAVCLTGVLSIVIPFGLLMGKDGLVAAGLNRPTRVPTPQLTSCATGQTLADLTLRPEQCVLITGRGFAPRELIQVREASRPGWHALVWADENGRFSLRFQLPPATPAGPDVLSFAGTHQADPATIPAIAFCRFTVRTD
jgi:hypothetical protein